MSAFDDDVLERLEPLGELRSKRMFGGLGLYCGSAFFAIAWKGTLYFKVDDTTRPAYERAGAVAFRPLAKRPEMNGYFEVPESVLVRNERLLEWAAASVAVAKRAAPKVKSRSRSAGNKLRNLGPVSRRWLAAIGVVSRADLERVGSIGAYRLVRKQQRGASLLLLYALEAALLDVDWRKLPSDLKRRLREAVEP